MEDKKRAVLAKYVKMVELDLEGIQLLRYWNRMNEASECEEKLNRYKTILFEMTADKQTMMETVAGVETVSNYMMWIFNQALCGAYGYETNEAYRPEVDKNYMVYAVKVQKSVDAKQTHAPGFDL